MSLVSSLVGGLNIAGFTISPPTVQKVVPMRGEDGYNIFVVNPNLQRGQRSRTLTARAQLSGINKHNKRNESHPESFVHQLQRMPHINAVSLLMCNIEEEATLFNTTPRKYLDTDLSDLPDDIESLDGAISQLKEEDIKDIQAACDSVNL